MMFSVTFQKTIHVIRGEYFVLEFEMMLKNQQAQAVTSAAPRSLSAVNGTVKINGTTNLSRKKRNSQILTSPLT
jgi:competence protein ComGD